MSRAELAVGSRSAGEVTGDSMDMTMTVDGNDPDMGTMHMVVSMNSQRVGDCTAG